MDGPAREATHNHSQAKTNAPDQKNKKAAVILLMIGGPTRFGRRLIGDIANARINLSQLFVVCHTLKMQAVARLRLGVYATAACASHLCQRDLAHLGLIDIGVMLLCDEHRTVSLAAQHDQVIRRQSHTG